MYIVSRSLASSDMYIAFFLIRLNSIFLWLTLLVQFIFDFSVPSENENQKKSTESEINEGEEWKKKKYERVEWLMGNVDKS